MLMPSRSTRQSCPSACASILTARTSDPRVRPVVNDARTFLRNSTDKYDMIVYGLLDSHALLSHGSSVRLDSFVYTVQAFREARERLNDGGVLSLAFTVISPEQARKTFLMLQEAFAGDMPIVIRAHYDGAVVFLQQKGQPIKLPSALLSGTDFSDVTAKMADTTLLVDVSTDDWPFFYMPRRVYPLSYLLVVGLLLLLSLLLIRPFFAARPSVSQGGFFLLGAGFMLIETKGITELGLTFGNTWVVIGVVIAGILVMAFVANCVVQWLQLRSLAVPYVLLLASLVAGLILMGSGGFSPTPTGRLMAVCTTHVPAILLRNGLLHHAAIVRRSLRRNGRQSLRGNVRRVPGVQLHVFWLPVLVLVCVGHLWRSVALLIPQPAPSVAGRRALTWPRLTRGLVHARPRPAVHARVVAAADDLRTQSRATSQTP